ncbi:MAG: hypothetical protein MJE66_14260 [Proteobacteria bacterium]|nr:hypothetical protein [Pseudomonadota bacterium]
MTGAEFYDTSLQLLYAPLVVPVLFGLYRLTTRATAERARFPEAIPFVSLYCTLFLLQTLCDLLARGPGVAALGGAGSVADQMVGLIMVLLGDWRVLWLVFALSLPTHAAVRAVVFSLLGAFAVPLLAGIAFRLSGTDEARVLYLVHELLFTGLALALATWWVPTRVPAGPLRGFLRGACGYVAAYYALWATADVIILLGSDLGFWLRVIPNQLYYSCWVPFVWFTAFRLRA